ncbi:MAG TPA: hypothetical protein VLQ93_06865 [Myxococcaceae bacterium]|nr:hypothetical protein [Myxococcaceae bacterium]
MLPRSSISTDESLWPLRLVRFEGTATSRQFRSYLDESSASLGRGQEHAVIVDLSRGGPLPFDQRQAQAAWLRENEQRLRELSLGVAFIITSPLVRLAMSASFYWKAMPVPYIITPHLTEAAGWVVQRFEEAGMFPAAERVRRHFQLSSLHAQ